METTMLSPLTISPSTAASSPPGNICLLHRPAPFFPEATRICRLRCPAAPILPKTPVLNSAVSEGILTDCGVIYLRETNQALTGHVDYTINGEAQSPKSFTMDAPGDFARNHSWTLYGYFLGGRNLQMSVRVLPWDYTVWGVNFSDDSVQSSQLFIDDTTVSMREVSSGHFDVRLLAGVTAKLHLFINAPVSGKLMIRPMGDAGSFLVTPDMADINPSVDGGRIDIDIRRNPAAEGDLTGHYITLSFSVELGEREIDANTEILNNDVYRFIL